MPENAADIAERIDTLLQPGYREQLLAKGLARGLIWRDGVLPPDAPQFGDSLSLDLLDHGFLLLLSSLRLRDLGHDTATVNRGLHAAAEALESASRHEAVTDHQRGFHLVMAAAAFHIGGYAARAFSLFERDLASLNLASYESCLVFLMRRDLVRMRDVIREWVNNSDTSDRSIVRLLETGHLTADDVIPISLTRLFLQAIAVFEMGLLTGQTHYRDTAMEQLRTGESASRDANHVPLWWAFTVARHLCDDLWDNSLQVLLPKDGGPTQWPVLRDRFIQTLAARQPAVLDLWPSQVDAAHRVTDATDDLVVALPTSAGKTRIAELCILRTLADHKRVIYVTPLRALSAQTEQSLAETFRPLGYSVTSVYGASGVAHSDLETLRSAAIVVATPEKLDFAIRQEPSVIDDVGLIVLDEGHMIGLSERELRYEMLVQRLLRRTDSDSRRLVCLSAVFSEGDAFDDFTNWLRSDAVGDPIRSTWRPTRQRPGRLLWTGKAGRLELDVEGERPFVPRFVEPRAPIRPRRKPFPNSDQEFLVAAARSFLDRGQSVLVYCPQRRSVEATAAAFLEAAEKGYFPSVLAPADKRQIDDASRIGEEWLGKSHPAVASLRIGVAVHHGSLPRQFLSEIESLLRRRTLRICVCSPTLAQGLDLSFSVLLFRSIYRYKAETIEPKEFANVVGRVGRAFVDLDGLYVFPIFDLDKGKVRRKLAAFNSLIVQARQRQLESGVRMLVGTIIRVLQARLGCNPEQLKEYVLNQQSAWQVEKKEDDEWAEWLESALNELDTAILGIVDSLDLPTDALADYLDECLQSSYWQRRLARLISEQRDLQQHVIRGRAAWIWSRTNGQKRRAFFSAGIGFKAGDEIDRQLPEIGQLLEDAESAIANADLDTAVQHVLALADILFLIGPFVPEDAYANWKKVLGHWLRGTALGRFADNEGISFIQQNVVYRLVWAVEAARVHLQFLQPSDNEPPGGILAQCLTYGVPSQTSAVFMQAGLRSRTMATALLDTLDVDIPTMDVLRAWIDTVKAGIVDPITWDTADETHEWDHFLRRFEHRNIRTMRDIDLELSPRWRGRIPKDNVRVRVERVGESREASIYSTKLVELGTTKIPSEVIAKHFTGKVSNDGQSISVSFYGR
jgi:replicative superfamily II helicase